MKTSNLKTNSILDESDNEITITDNEFTCWCYSDIKYDLEDVAKKAKEYCRISTEAKVTFIGSMKVRRCLLDYCICDDSILSKHKGKVIFKDTQEINRLRVGYVGLKGSIKTNHLDLGSDFKLDIELDVLEKSKKCFIVVADLKDKCSGKINMTSEFFEKMSEDNKKLIYNDHRIEYLVDDKPITKVLNKKYLISNADELEKLYINLDSEFYTACKKQGLVNMYNTP